MIRFAASHRRARPSQRCPRRRWRRGARCSAALSSVRVVARAPNRAAFRHRSPPLSAFGGPRSGASSTSRQVSGFDSRAAALVRSLIGLFHHTLSRTSTAEAPSQRAIFDTAPAAPSGLDPLHPSGRPVHCRSRSALSKQRAHRSLAPTLREHFAGRGLRPRNRPALGLRRGCRSRQLPSRPRRVFSQLARD